MSGVGRLDLATKAQEKKCQRRGCHKRWRRLQLCSKHLREYLSLNPQPEPQCSQDACSNPVLAPGRCSLHQYELYKQLQPEALKAIEVRLAGKLRAGRNGCWEWTGRVNPDQYGKTDVNFQKGVLVHRWMWMHLVGPIPLGMHLDHLCVNPCCVRPGHLQPVTPEDHEDITSERRRLLLEAGGDYEWVGPNIHRSLSEAFFGIMFDLPYTLGSMVLPSNLEFAPALAC